MEILIFNYISMLQLDPNSEFSDGNNDLKSIQYMESDVVVIFKSDLKQLTSDSSWSR